MYDLFSKKISHVWNKVNYCGKLFIDNTHSLTSDVDAIADIALQIYFYWLYLSIYVHMLY